jgi:hypothetical protein
MPLAYLPAACTSSIRRFRPTARAARVSVPSVTIVDLSADAAER